MKNKELSSGQPWRVWAFVIGLNAVAFLGLLYLKANGIDLYAFRGGK